MKCFIFSRDLMFSSQAAGAAKSAGLETQTVMNAQLIESDAECIVVVDLTVSNLDIATVIGELKSLTPPAKVIAVGPHVHEEKLAAAQQAGCDLVMSKGQASRELGAVLKQFTS